MSCARGAGGATEQPVALRRLRILEMAPEARVGGSEPLAQLATTLLKVLLKGYVPSMEAIVQNSVTYLHRAMNLQVKQTLETTPPCERTGVYFGPEGIVNLSLLLISFLLALLSLLVFFSSPLHSEDEEDFHPDAGTQQNGNELSIT